MLLASTRGMRKLFSVHILDVQKIFVLQLISSMIVEPSILIELCKQQYSFIMSRLLRLRTTFFFPLPFSAQGNSSVLKRLNVAVFLFFSFPSSSRTVNGMVLFTFRTRQNRYRIENNDLRIDLFTFFLTFFRRDSNCFFFLFSFQHAYAVHWGPTILVSNVSRADEVYMYIVQVIENTYLQRTRSKWPCLLVTHRSTMAPLTLVRWSVYCSQSANISIVYLYPSPDSQFVVFFSSL